MLKTKLRRLFAISSSLLLALIFQVSTINAQAICDNFVNSCTVPSSLETYTIQDSLFGTTGQVGEPRPSTDWADDENPYTTTWYHWTPPRSGTIIVDTRGTNPNAAPPNYEFPFVIDTLVAVYTGSTLTTLTRRAENDNWGFGGGCTNAIPVGESTRSSCLKMPVTAGTTYHFQVDKFAEADPSNNGFFLKVTFLPPTAANVSVSGRITDNFGRGASRTSVILTDVNGNSRTALTNAFGYYRFDEVTVGQAYTLEARRKGATFVNNPRVVSLLDEVQNEDFTMFENSGPPRK